MAHDVFISYAMEDKASADAVCATLEGRKVRCWIAPRDIMPGANWPTAIVEAISHCKVMVLIYSHHSNQSEMVMREVQVAANHEVVIVPLRMEDAPLADFMQFFIASRHWLDAMTPPLEHHLEKLCDTVETLLEADATRNAAPDAERRGDQIAAPPLRPDARTGSHREPSTPASGAARDSAAWRRPVAIVGGVAALLFAAGAAVLLATSGGSPNVTATPGLTDAPTASSSTVAPPELATLLTPEADATLPQQPIGMCDSASPVQWTFSWSAPSDFPQSEIAIMNPAGGVYKSATSSTLSYSVSLSCFDYIDPGQLSDWSWHVRGVKDDGSTSSWSAARKFNVARRVDCGAPQCQVAVLVQPTLPNPDCTLRVRREADASSDVLGCCAPATQLALLGPSSVTSDVVWWQVSVVTPMGNQCVAGQTGWVAERQLFTDPTTKDLTFLSTAHP